MGVANGVSVLTANMHVGQAASAPFCAQIQHLDPDILLMQEMVGESLAVVKHFLGGRYHVIPNQFHRLGREATQTPILLHRKRFRLRRQSNRQISAWLGGGDHHRMWPTRFATQVRALDVTTGRVFNVRSVHTWALGHEAPTQVQDGHRAQVVHAGGWAAKKNPEHVTLLGGDWNEDMRGHSYAERILTASGCKRAGMGRHLPSAHTSLHGGAWLDDVFYRKAPHIRVADQRIIPNAGRGADHLMVWTDFLVQPKR